MKEEILDLIETFGLITDYDQWDNKGWIRVQCITDGMKPLIIFKAHVDIDGILTVKKDLRNYLMQIGEHNFKLKLNKLINL